MKIPFTKYAIKGYNATLEQHYRECAEATACMSQRSHSRSHIINALLKNTTQKRYLEIGVRNPDDNFNRINAEYKVSVDPGTESVFNQATFSMTSDAFFEKLFAGELSIQHRMFDVIFIDGLHLADQVYRDIVNSVRVVADIGYIVMHDCNPPTIYHAREDFRHQTPATHYWNGTSWKAYQRFRTESDKRCFVVDVDWGVGVIVNHEENPSNRLSANINPFYEYNVLDSNRKKILNLMSVDQARELVSLKK